MISLLPDAKRISPEENAAPKTEYRILGLGFLFVIGIVLFGVLIIYGLVMSEVNVYFDDDSPVNKTLTMIFIITLSILIILFFISDIRLITAEGKAAVLTTAHGGKVSSVMPLTAIGIFLLFYACIRGSKEDPKSAYPLYVFIVFLAARSVFRFTLKPLIRFIAIKTRKNRCTVPARAEFIRSIDLYKDSRSVREGDEPAEKEPSDKENSIFLYDYCHEGEWFRIMSEKKYCKMPEDLEYYDLYVDPLRPERYYIRDHAYFRVNRKEAKEAAFLLFFLLAFTLPLWLFTVLDFIAEHI